MLWNSSLIPNSSYMILLTISQLCYVLLWFMVQNFLEDKPFLVIDHFLLNMRWYHRLAPVQPVSQSRFCENKRHACPTTPIVRHMSAVCSVGFCSVARRTHIFHNSFNQIIVSESGDAPKTRTRSTKTAHFDDGRRWFAGGLTADGRGSACVGIGSIGEDAVYWCRFECTRMHKHTRHSVDGCCCRCLCYKPRAHWDTYSMDELILGAR